MMQRFLPRYNRHGDEERGIGALGSGRTAPATPTDRLDPVDYREATLSERQPRYRAMTFLKRTPARWAAILLMLGLLFGPFPIPLRVLVLACGALLWTLLEAGNLRPIGMGRHRPAAILAWGIGGAIGIIALGQIVLPLIMKMLGVQIDLSGYGALTGNADAALKLLSYALTSAAIGEEILFRGFLLHQMTAILGSDSRGKWAAIILSAVAFGLAHFIQGPVGIVSTGLTAIAIGWLWFLSNRNLWSLILAHALIDGFGIGMLYLGWSAF